MVLYKYIYYYCYNRLDITTVCHTGIKEILHMQDYLLHTIKADRPLTCDTQNAP